MNTSIGDLVRHRIDPDSLGIVVENDDCDDIRIMWLDADYPAIEFYPRYEIRIISTSDLDT